MRPRILLPLPAAPPVLAPSVLALGGVLLLAGCSGAGTADAEPPAYDREAGLSARVLPQLAHQGEDVEKAADAAWVVEASLDRAELGEDAAGAEVRLYALTDGGWDVVDEAETDKKGVASLTTDVDGDLHVVAEVDSAEIGAAVAADEAPAVSFSDDFDENSLDEDGAAWATRHQGYIGVRTCSKADASAAEVTDGLMRLSVLDDPDAGECTVGKDRHDFRLNGHVSTEGAYQFTYGYAAARVKFQPERGQHGSFWMQTPGGPAGKTPQKAGAEIDVVEYFGDDHPQGGLTSFTYWFDPSGKRRTQGGWIEDAEQYGEDWAEQFHVFSVEWTPQEYVFRIDGQVTHRLKGPTSAQPEFLILSLLSSDYELKHADELPQHMDVDWVRAWETPQG